MAGGWRVGALVLVLALIPMAAHAQPRGDVSVALDRTDQVIARADAAVVAGPNQLANDYLDQARQFQARARSAYASGLLADAFRLTNAARRRASAAIDLERQAGNPGFLPVAIGRTDALLDRIAPFLGDCPNDQASNLFESALDLQRQAKDALQLGRPRVALSLTTDARGRATRALRMADDSCGGPRERAQRALANTDELLGDSAWLLDAGGKPARVYVAALDTQKRAKGELAQGHFPDALDLTISARDELVRALSRSDSPLARDAVAQAVQASADRLGQARPAANDPARRDALDQASEHQRRAQDLLERGRLAPCLAEVHAVRAILERAGL
jgi:hypothetical protein